MANIFNLFGEKSELHKGPIIKPLAQSETTANINGASLKSINRLKSKGLSIRSRSDLNVPPIIQGTPNKQQELLKPKLLHLNNNGKLTSPKKDLSFKKLIESSNKIRGTSPNRILNTKNIRLPESYDESIFKKPLPLKSHIKKNYPKPESLAPYCDMQSEFDNIYTKVIENEFKELLLKKRNDIMLYKDEGFESDPEFIEFEIPKLHISSKLFNEKWIQHKIPDLPKLSDEEDNF
ncbi:PREDICTED: uncharacterized protein LOC108552182 [Eufriesea mexicana]|uniref:uncharacterized protein LOC108552182 n=1 Tax=Eufriesea mexicana TaxID=516756 RepID=UPI00083C3E2A|nr:PREDICTED: uncharacterized protein LOC108552182 [Eufriesea mexicana]